MIYQGSSGYGLLSWSTFREGLANDPVTLPIRCSFGRLRQLQVLAPVQRSALDRDEVLCIIFVRLDQPVATSRAEFIGDHVGCIGERRVEGTERPRRGVLLDRASQTFFDYKVDTIEKPHP